MNQEFHDKLSQYANENNCKAANVLIMRELGNVIVRHRKDFIHLLNECGIQASESMTDNQLVDAYVKNLVNQKLLLGTALLVNIHNKAMNADGSSELSDEGVKTTYDCLYENFIGEEHSNAAADPVTAVAQGVGELSKLGGKLSESRQKKKYGTQDALQKQVDARNQLNQQIISQKQAQADADKSSKEQKHKTLRTVLIVSGVVLGLAAIGFAIYKFRKK